MAGTVGEYSDGVSKELWRRYVGLLLQGMRCQPGLERLPVDALTHDELQDAMSTWQVTPD